MKKYGKYERRPEAAESKQPQVKSVLLQTYFTSLMCLVLCVTMFMGTSYAWFTSEVNNMANEIYVGTLKVGLSKHENGALQDLASNESNAAKLFDGSIRWEPGYTTLETIEITNQGDLAFKYVLNFTDGAISEGGDLESIAKHFDVWVFDHQNSQGIQYYAPTSYDMIGLNNGWVHIGTLADVLAGTPVLDNKSMTAGSSSDIYTIALHMKESADASVMGYKLSLNVKLIAYQMSSESDDLGTGYDNVSSPSNLEELTAALENYESVVLLSDIEIDSVSDTLTMQGGVIDGGGNTISYTGEKDSGGNSVGVLTTPGGTVSNLAINGGSNGRALYVTNLGTDLFVSDCILSGAYAFNVNSAQVTGKTMTFVDTTFKSWVSYANVMEHAYFTGCKFEGTLRPYGDTTLTDCTFTGETLDVSALQFEETVTLINCTYNGTKIDMAVLKATGGTVTVEGSSKISVTSDKLVKLG